MNEFWDWMIDKGFAQVGQGKAIYTKYDKGIIPPKQMLIGYMIEYLHEMKQETNMVLFSDSAEMAYDGLEEVINRFADKQKL